MLHHNNNGKRRISFVPCISLSNNNRRFKTPVAKSLFKSAVRTSTAKRRKRESRKRHYPRQVTAAGLRRRPCHVIAIRPVRSIALVATSRVKQESSSGHNRKPTEDTGLRSNRRKTRHRHTTRPAVDVQSRHFARLRFHRV